MSHGATCPATRPAESSGAPCLAAQSLAHLAPGPATPAYQSPQSWGSADWYWWFVDVLAEQQPRFRALDAARFRPPDWNKWGCAADQTLVARWYQLLIERSALGVSHEVAGDREPARPGGLHDDPY